MAKGTSVYNLVSFRIENYGTIGLKVRHNLTSLVADRCVRYGNACIEYLEFEWLT